MRDPIRTMIADVRATAFPSQRADDEGGGAAPFITISRMAGAGGNTLAQHLAQRLNEGQEGDAGWRVFDRELVELIARDHDISESLVATFGDTGRSWLTEALSGLQFSGNAPSEVKLYRKVAESVLALARMGRSIIVGRGGMFITQSLAGGTHLLIVAPLEHRVRHMAELRKTTDAEAARYVRETDANRAEFYRRNWPDSPHGPESFTLTLNSAKMDEQEMAEAVLPLVKARQQQPTG